MTGSVVVLHASMPPGLAGLMANAWNYRDGIPSTCLHAAPQGAQQQQHRRYAKAGGKGAAKPAAKAPAKAETPAADPKLATPLSKLNWVHKGKAVAPASLLTPEQKEAMENVTGTSASEDNPEGLVSFKQMGIPVTPADTLQLIHQSFSRTMGENVHVRPFVYNNVFQSAPGLAQYVANALEAGTSWQRIERFFLSCMDEDNTVAAIKVQVKGRLGQKADMSRKKVWEKGSLKLGHLSCPVDYGQAQALTRMGVLGVKVWMRYKQSVASSSMAHKQPARPALSLASLLSIPRTPVPASASAWWNTPGPLQPLTNRTWHAVNPAFDPTSMSAEKFLQERQPLLFKNNKERRLHLAKLHAATKQPVLPAPQSTSTSAPSAMSAAGTSHDGSATT